MRRHEPDPVAAVAALSRRLDSLDQSVSRIDAIDADIAAFGRGLGELTSQVANLTEATARRIFEPPTRRDAEPTGADDETPTVKQPDWLTVTDSAAATQWLCDATEFAAEVLPCLGRFALSGCWALHPAAVADVIALQLQYRTAYSCPDPTAVSELLARWLPGTVRRLISETGGCVFAVV